MANLKISQFTNLAGAQTPTSIVPVVVNNSAPNYFSTLNDLFTDLSLNTSSGQIKISNATLSSDGENALRITGTATVPADSIIDGIDARLIIATGTAAGTDGYFTAISGAALCSAASNAPDWAIGVSGTAQYNAVAGTTLPNAVGVYGYTNANGPVTITSAYGLYSANAGITVGAVITSQYGLFIEGITGATNNYAIKTNAGLNALGDHVIIGGQSTASELRLLEPSGSGTNYTGFVAPALAVNVIYTLPTADGTSGQVLQTDGSKVLSWATVAATPAGSSGDYQINNAGAFGAGVITQSAGRITITPTAQSSGVASYHRIITPADTNQTASTEAIGIQYGGNTSAATVTRQWAAGALTTQRENLFVAPTYAFASASTLTRAVTLEAASPIAGTNATLTNSIAARFIASAAAHVPLVVQGAVSQSGNLLQAQNSSGTPVFSVNNTGGFGNTDQPFVFSSNSGTFFQGNAFGNYKAKWDLDGFSSFINFTWNQNGFYYRC